MSRDPITPPSLPRLRPPESSPFGMPPSAGLHRSDRVPTTPPVDSTDAPEPFDLEIVPSTPMARRPAGIPLRPAEPDHSARPEPTPRIEPERLGVANATRAPGGQDFPTRPPKAPGPVVSLDHTLPPAPAARNTGFPGEPPQPSLSRPPQLPYRAPPAGPVFLPREPKNLVEAGLDSSMVELLVLRFLLSRGSASVRDTSNELGLSVQPISEVLELLRGQKFTQHRGSTSVGDFVYELTEMGRNKALESRRLTTYVGPAPVPWEQYLVAVAQQSLAQRRPNPEDLARAFDDLLISPSLLARLGPAISSGKAMFLFGDPGNGKTSIAERVTAVFGDTIWIPSSLSIDGHLVKTFDPATHEEVPYLPKPGALERVDRRWVHIKRPTVVAGGELTLEMLEIQTSPAFGISEAPLQLKANGGTLVIDDFGRQQIAPQALLNRWIFPLERRQDFLRLPDGRKVPAPFECLLIFSTNLEPKDLVDEAFLRRIPYKLQLHDPSEAEFRELIDRFARKMQVTVPMGSVNYLLEQHYRKAARKLRFCHPRDLLHQVVSRCQFERRPAVAAPDDWDAAVGNYFCVK